MDRDRSAEAALSGLAFIELPPALARGIGSFKPDPKRLLPVETAGAAERFDPKEITGEALIAGMLRVLAWNPDHENAEYYRSFVNAVKPGILAELSAAGIAKAQQGEWEVAEEIFRALSGLCPEAPEPLLDLAIIAEDRAEALSRSGREDEAEEMDERAHKTYDRLLGFDPPFAPAFFNAAFFYVRKRNFERAASLLETYISVGDDEDKMARAREALEQFRMHGYLDNLFKEAYDFIRLGEEEKGLAKAKEFVSRHPELWNGWFLVGWACRRLGRWEEGVEAFQRSLALYAEGVDSLNELSICLLELERIAESRHALEKALKLEPENVKVITNLGVVALRQGERKEAAGFFRTAIELDPEDVAAATWLERIEGMGA